eukprot:Sdes_comp10395_c0_seq1m2053
MRLVGTASLHSFVPDKIIHERFLQINPEQRSRAVQQRPLCGERLSGGNAHHRVRIGKQGAFHSAGCDQVKLVGDGDEDVACKGAGEEGGWADAGRDELHEALILGRVFGDEGNETGAEEAVVAVSDQVRVEIIAGMLVAQVPFCPSSNALAQAHCRLDLQNSLRQRGVRKGEGHIAGGHGHKVLDGLLLQRCFQHGDEFVHVFGMPLPQIEHLKGGLAMDGSNHPVHNIAHIRKVPLQVAPLVHIERDPVHNLLAKLVHGHVGPPKGPVHCEEPQASHRDPVHVVVGVSNRLVGLLGGPVNAGGVIDAIEGREGLLFVGAIHGGGRCVDEAHFGRLFDHFQQPHKAVQIRLYIRVGVHQRVADPCLGGQMHHMGEPMRAEEQLQ